jgi:hypothetical protein
MARTTQSELCGSSASIAVDKLLPHNRLTRTQLWMSEGELINFSKLCVVIIQPTKQNVFGKIVLEVKLYRPHSYVFLPTVFLYPLCYFSHLYVPISVRICVGRANENTPRVTRRYVGYHISVTRRSFHTAHLGSRHVVFPYRLRPSARPIRADRSFVAKKLARRDYCLRADSRARLVWAASGLGDPPCAVVFARQTEPLELAGLRRARWNMRLVLPSALNLAFAS